MSVLGFAPSLDASPLTRLQHAWGKFLGAVPVILAPLAVLILGQVVTGLAGGVRVPVQVFAWTHLLFAIPIALGAPAIAFGFVLWPVPGATLDRVTLSLSPNTPTARLRFSLGE